MSNLLPSPYFRLVFLYAAINKRVLHLGILGILKVLLYKTIVITFIFMKGRCFFLRMEKSRKERK